MTTWSSMKVHSNMNLVVLKLYPTIYKLLLLRISQRLGRLDLGMHAHFINRNRWSMKMKNFNTSVSCRHFMGKGGRSSTVRKWPHLLMLESKENRLLLLISRTQVWWMRINAAALYSSTPMVRMQEIKYALYLSIYLYYLLYHGIWLYVNSAALYTSLAYPWNMLVWTH